MVEFVRAADLMPADVDAQLQAVRSLLRARRFDEARARADRILQLEPRHVEALIARAAAIARMADVTHGLFEIQQAIRLHPSDPRVRMMMGTLQGTLRHFVEGEAAFKRAVELSPVDRYPRALAIFYWRYGRLPEAETWLRRTVNLQPMVLDSRQRLASFLVATGRAEEAEEPLADAGRDDPHGRRAARAGRLLRPAGSARPRPVAARAPGGAGRRHHDAGAAAAGPDSLPRTTDRGGAPWR